MSYRVKQKQASRAKLGAAIYNLTMGFMVGLIVASALYLNLI